jgi:HSP20 family protein
MANAAATVAAGMAAETRSAIMMLMRRMNPASPLNELRREFDRLFDTVLSGETYPNQARPFPALNAWEDGDRLMIEAEVPGLSLDDLDITIQGNELTIKGQRKPMVGDDLVYHRRERGVGEFSRFLTLPTKVDGERVEAALKDGVLTIMLPKAETAKARKIAVRSA